MKLSVVMITYNHERFIAEALQSILSQRTNFDFEIVVGEDCSTDGTRDILLDFHRRFPGRIIPLLRDRNLGVMRNLQETLVACRGKYLAFLEGDDYWSRDDKLQRQTDFLDSHPDCAICCHRAQFRDEMRATDTDLFPTLPAGRYTIDDLLRGNFVMTCTAVLRRDWIGPLPHWFSEMQLGDWPLFALVAQHGDINLLDEISSVYRVHAGGVWSSRTQISRLQETIRMLHAIDKEFGSRHAGLIRQKIAECYLEWATVAQREGRRMETGMCLLNAVRNGGATQRSSRQALKGCAWFTLLGGWHPALARAKRAILG